MSITLIIIISTIVAFIATVLVKPSITIKKHNVSIYWLVPLIGDVLLLALSLISPNIIIKGLTTNTSINPIKILVLFLSMTFMSIYLDEVGFFRYLANLTLKKAKSNQKILFIYLYVTVSVLTVFTSNDIIILTFTPFICYFAKNAKIDPIPYLFAEFVAANTWSMMLIIGNPTNVYLATANNINFLQYVSVMLLPTICGGLTSFIILYILFNKRLNKKIEASNDDIQITNKKILIIGLVHLGLCTILLTISSYVGFEMWLITFAFMVSLIVVTLVLQLMRKSDKSLLVSCAKRMPWELIPFIISMFVLVLTLNNIGITEKISQIFKDDYVIIKYGVASFVSANLINNIPMSVLFSSVINKVPRTIIKQAVYASIIGSNICAFSTPIGALAGIMWSGILKDHHVKFSFSTFVKYGIIISLPTLTAALMGLCLRFLR